MKRRRPGTPGTAIKILSRSAAIVFRRRLKRTRQRVVFANGVFDILHPGHISLLETAAALGDALIVGVNSDASARRLGKGPGRPVNPLARRMRILAALACIDAVVAFGEKTPETIMSKLRPDIQVKGGDYRPEEVPERVYAGKLVLVSLKKGHSTTSLIRKLRKK